MQVQTLRIYDHGPQALVSGALSASHGDVARAPAIDDPPDEIEIVLEDGVEDLTDEARDVRTTDRYRCVRR